MKNNNAKNLLLVIPVALTLSACGGTPDRTSTMPDNTPYQVTEAYNSGVIRYTVQRGDRLGSIAQEFTGQSSKWRDIAQHNNISNPRRLMEGTEIEIPTDLIPGYQRPTPVAPTVRTEPNPSAQQTPALAIRRNQPTEVSPVVVTPIDTNRDFELNPIDQNAVGQRTYSGSATQIKVVGTYYPKGVYTEPAAYSKLIMRVAPGTVFSLDSQVNEWYKIETEKGTGYIRASDAAILE